MPLNRVAVPGAFIRRIACFTDKRDVRFVYVRPQDWYLSIDVEDRRDVIEYPIVDEIDLTLSKAGLGFA